MPSASSKSEKPTSTEATDPIKQAIVIIGHKIRNLEKRKSRLDSYKESINSLSKEQVEAISKYDEVIQQLELSKEYVKQFTVISVESDRLKKKQAKKDAQEKYVSEINKVKQVLMIQDVLQNMGNELVREDFLAGRNGAIQLTENDLKTLDDLYVEVSPKRILEDGTASLDQFQKAAEYLMSIVEGKAKEIVGSTGAKIRELVTSINTCGYFDQVAPETNPEGSAPSTENETLLEEKFQNNKEIMSNVIVPTPNPAEGNIPPPQNPSPVQPVMPGAPILPAAAQPPMMQPNQQPIVTPNVSTIVPTPVSQVESSFFNAQGFKQPAPPSVIPPPNQNSRQINDVIQSVTGKFNFLQESELDMPEINSVAVPGNPPVATPQMPGAPPSTIPTQTFTNQNFNGQPAAAPPYPPNYPPQPAAFQTFVTAFPAFVPPNASPVQNANTSTNPGNPATVTPINSTVNPNIPTSNNNINSNNNKVNNIPNPIQMAPNRNPNVNYNQGVAQRPENKQTFSISNQQPLPSGYANQQNPQNISQPSSQPGFTHANMTIGSVDNAKIEDAVRRERDQDQQIKEKQENEKQDWSQQESTHWADDFTGTSEWNSPNQNQSDGRPNRNGGGAPRNMNGYQGNRNRTNRQGGYRDSQSNQGGGTNNYYQNQNGYQSRNDRNNEYSVGGKGNSDGGGFRRGPPPNRGLNMKGPGDRGDRAGGPIQRNNPGGPRGGGPRNLNRQPGGRNGPSFQRQQPNTVGQPNNK